MGGWAFPGSQLPDDDAGDGRGPLPGGACGDRGVVAGDDADDGHFEWLVREVDAGRLLPPPQYAAEGRAVSVSLGDACDLDPGLLAAMCGPDGLGGQAALAAFGEGKAVDTLRPGPVLAALTAQAVSRVTSGPDLQAGAAQEPSGPGSHPGPRRGPQEGPPPGPPSGPERGPLADFRSGPHPGPPPGPEPAPEPAPLTDDELVGVLQATRRLANLAAWQQTVVIAEFARRRQARFEATRAAGAPAGCRDGEFPGEELAMELVATGPYTSGRIDTAVELVTRLPLTLAGMEDGLIDLGRACAIAARTQSMTDADAAYADAVLAAAAPGLRLDQLAHKAEALEKKLAPEAVKARRELARHLGQRVEARREESGNASLAGRELDTADVIASKAYIDALAARLRNSGLFAGPVGRLRALVLTDLTQGRNPLDRITTARPAPVPEAAEWPDTASPDSGAQSPEHPDSGARPSEQPASTPPGRDTEVSGSPVTGHDEQATFPPGSTPGADGDPLACPGDEEDELSESPWRGPAPGDPVPLPALVNILVPAGTLLGWGTAPAQAAGWGLLDPDETQALVRAASQHPRTRWCMTIIAPDGTALAHGCAVGRHPWPPNDPPPPPPSPPPQRTPGTPGGPGDAPSRSAGTPGGSAEAPSPQQAAQLLGLLRRLNITLEPIATDTCGHAHAEDRYVPSRKLKHLIHARNQTCTAPACNAQAQHCDLDHTVPYPDGPTDECNLNPKCRRHHRTKQAPDWNAAQPAPGTATWTTPSGRTHTTTATTYDL